MAEGGGEWRRVAKGGATHRIEGRGGDWVLVLSRFVRIGKRDEGAGRNFKLIITGHNGTGAAARRRGARGCAGLRKQAVHGMAPPLQNGQDEPADLGRANLFTLACI